MQSIASCTAILARIWAKRRPPAAVQLPRPESAYAKFSGEFFTPISGVRLLHCLSFQMSLLYTDNMNGTVLTIEDAARCLPDLVEQVHANGEAALLVKSGRPLARIVPVSARERGAEDLIAFLRRWRIEHPEPDEQIAEAIEESRKAVGPPHDPLE